jgi:hypothetical protein
VPVVGGRGRSARPPRSAWARRRSPSPRMHRRRVTASLSGPSQRTTRRPTARSATAHARKGSSGERCGMRKNPHRMALVTASLTGSTTSLTTSSGMAAGSCCKLVRTARRSPARQVGEPATETPAIARCRRCGRHGLVEGGPAGPGSAAPSPDEPGGGVAPAQPRPVAAPASRHRHSCVLLGQCRPSSSPWPATAGPAPPPAARCRAPNTAGRRGYRTAGRGRGRPDSASRRSAGCTDGRPRAWASTCSGGPCQAPSRARGRSPRADGSSGRSRGLTALAWLPGSDQPNQAGGHGLAGAASRFHRTLRRSGLPGTVWSGRDPKATVPCPQIRSASGPPYAGALTRRSGRLTRRARPLLEQAATWPGGKLLGTAPEPRGPGHQLRTAMGGAGLAPPRSSPWARRRWPYVELGPGRPIPVTAMRPWAARPR